MAKLTDDELEVRGHRAASILGDDLVKEALSGMRERAIERWRESGRLEDREEEWRFVRTIDEFERLLGISLRQGQAAANRIRDREKRKERLRRTILGAA